MNGALAVLVIAVSGTSLIWMLVAQFHNRRSRARSRDGAGSDGGYYAGDDSGSHLGWSGSGHAASDHSAGSQDAGGSGDSGGGDSGGGDGGDGGGSD